MTIIFPDKHDVEHFMQALSLEGMQAFGQGHITDYDPINAGIIRGVTYVVSAIMERALSEREILLDHALLCDIFRGDERIMVAVTIGEWLIYADGENRLELLAVDDYLAAHGAEIWSSMSLREFEDSWRHLFN